MTHSDIAKKWFEALKNLCSAQVDEEFRPFVMIGILRGLSTAKAEIGHIKSWVENEEKDTAFCSGVLAAAEILEKSLEPKILLLTAYLEAINKTIKS